MSEKKNKNVIIAVHPDDEIIGCWEIIRDNDKENPPVILYMGDPIQERRQETLNLRKYTNIQIQLFCRSVPPIFLDPSTTLYFPDPISEIHPLHRLYGSQGEGYLRQGLDVIFYNTTMTVPYIHEVKEPQKKEELLNNVYPSQSDLWKYEKKYILFEGRYKWIM